MPRIEPPIIQPPIIINEPITVTEPSTGSGGTIVTPPGSDWWWGGDLTNWDPQKFAQEIINSIAQAFQGLIDSLINVLSAAAQTIYNTIVSIVAQIGQFFVNIAATIANGILTAVELAANMPAQFLNGYWELTIGSLVDVLATLGPLKPFAAPLAYAALIAETIPVVYAMGYLVLYTIKAFKMVILGVF